LEKIQQIQSQIVSGQLPRPMLRVPIKFAARRNERCPRLS
jgi:hypothetical protein